MNTDLIEPQNKGFSLGQFFGVFMVALVLVGFAWLKFSDPSFKGSDKNLNFKFSGVLDPSSGVVLDSPDFVRQYADSHKPLCTSAGNCGNEPAVQGASMSKFPIEPRGSDGIVKPRG